MKKNEKPLMSWIYVHLIIWSCTSLLLATNPSASNFSVAVAVAALCLAILPLTTYYSEQMQRTPKAFLIVPLLSCLLAFVICRLRADSLFEITSMLLSLSTAHLILQTWMRRFTPAFDIET
jgi:hypothetical protein